MKALYYENVVIGGGIAGMSCALALKEAGRDVALVTDELGGRVCYSKEYDNNFGAVFFMENYEHSKKILTDKGPLSLGLGSLHLFTSPTKHFKGNSPTMIAALPQFAKFSKFMKGTFMPEYAAYKKDCETMAVADAMVAHPEIAKYYHMKASELIAELGIDKICDNFINKFAYACTGSRIADLNALDFLNVAQGVVVPIHDFSFDGEAFSERLDGEVIIDTVVEVRKDKAGWEAITEGGLSLQCDNLVVATPARITKQLLETGEVRKPAKLVSYLCSGTPRPLYAKTPANYFSDAFDIIALATRADKLINVYAREEIDLCDYIDNCKVVDKRVWPDALYVYGEEVLPQDWGESLYIAGDHNGLGLEPAAISGIYAANRILGNC